MFQTRRRKIERLDFIVAGAQKSGTTALHYFLAKHPKITMGDQQEIHFFDDDATFATTVDYERLHKHYPLVAPSTIAGDCTPSYIYFKPAAERIWRYNPKIKLLVLLRNPVERAFAHWNMQRFKGREPLDFFDAVRQLERLFKLFPREQVKVVKFEEFKGKQHEMLVSIFSFLALEPLRSVRSKDRNIVPYERVMNWEERIFLYNLFADDIAKLERMLRWDCSDWKL